MTSKVGCVFPMAIWPEFRIRCIETTIIGKTHPTLYICCFIKVSSTLFLNFINEINIFMRMRNTKTMLILH